MRPRTLLEPEFFSVGSSNENEDDPRELDSDAEITQLDDSLLASLPAPRPPAKKAKLSVPTNQNKTTTRRNAQMTLTLNLLPTMPLDIIFQILGFLSPEDLLTMARTNKLFRETLLSPQATTVWKSSRVHAGAPHCPTDMREIEWVALLFGHVCQSCSTPHIRKIDLSIGRRVCARCKKRNTLAKVRFCMRFGIEDKEILELIPSTNDNGDSIRSVQAKQNSMYYWIPDIEYTLCKLSSLRDDIVKGLPNAEQNLEEFKMSRKLRVQNIKNDITRLNAWKSDIAEQRVQDLISARMKRKKDISDRMLDAGYLNEDLVDVKRDPECTRNKELTEGAWARIRGRLEAKAITTRNARLIREREVLLRKRRKIVNFLYAAYKKTLVPSQWLYLPRVINICEFECFKVLIEADSEVAIGPNDFTECMERLPGLLATRMEKLKFSLRESMNVTIQPTGIENPLELAIATFQCQRTCRKFRSTCTAGLVIGWDTIATHYCENENEGLEMTNWNFADVAYDADIVYNPNGRQFLFNAKASLVARDLVRYAGLEEDALASEMDAKNLRFGCRFCNDWRNTWVMRGHAVGYSWRDAVYHTITFHPSHNLPPAAVGSEYPTSQWEMLPEDERAMVLSKEAGDTKWLYPNYTCNHCPAHMVTQVRKETVIEHVETMHSVENPTDLEDYFYFQRYKLLLDERSRSYAIPMHRG